MSRHWALLALLFCTTRHYSRVSSSSSTSVKSTRLHTLNVINTAITKAAIAVNIFAFIPSPSVNAEINTLSATPAFQPKLCFQTIEQTALFIQQNCRTVLSYARSTGRLLYRGESNELNSSPTLNLHKPDLLSPDTYNPVAADYFRVLDSRMKNSFEAKASPSRGHLAVSNQMAASEWGAVCSIWPVDKFHYTWLKNTNQWWEDDWATPQGPRGPFFWRNEDAINTFLSQELIQDRYLDGALHKGAEVMLSTDSSDVSSIANSLLEFVHQQEGAGFKLNDAFESNNLIRNIKESGALLYVAVPLINEGRLLAKLGIVPYAFEAPVKTAEGRMDLGEESVKRRIDPLIDMESKRRIRKRLYF